MMMLASVFQYVTGGLLVLVSLLLIGLVLLQKNRGAGLSGAFGGVGGHSAFGTKTGDFLTWVTVGLTAAFMLLAVAANFAFQPEPSTPATPSISPAATPMTPAPATPAATPIQINPSGSGAQPIQVTPAAPAAAQPGAAPTTPPAESPASTTPPASPTSPAATPPPAPSGEQKPAEGAPKP